MSMMKKLAKNKRPENTTSIVKSPEINKDGIRKIFYYYGVQNELIVCVEELSELQKEICKSLRNKRDGTTTIAEEMADVMVTLEMLKIIYGIDNNRLIGLMNEKIDRTISIINKKEEANNAARI